MFWQSVLGGFGVLAHWQVWVAIILYAVLSFAWLIGIGLVVGKSESGARMAAGCLTLIGGMLFQTLLLGVLVLFLTPIMLGGEHTMPLGFFATFAWPIAKACFIALVVSGIFAMLPIIGDAPGLTTFIKGVIIFRLFSVDFIIYLLTMEYLRKGATLHVPNLYPGFWSSVGYLAITAGSVYICILIFAAFEIKISRNKYSDEGVVSTLVGMALMPILGLLPLFMYANYVTLAIQTATG